jgi:Transposase, Mutator family
VVEHTMDIGDWLRKQLEEAHPDLLRATVKDFAEALMSAEAEALWGACPGERSPERVNRRNGRGRAGLARPPALAGRARAQRRPARDQRRAPRPGRRDRGDAAQRRLAALPHARDAQPVPKSAQSFVATMRSPCTSFEFAMALRSPPPPQSAVA